VTCAKVKFLNDADSCVWSWSETFLSAFSGSSISWIDDANSRDCENLFFDAGVAFGGVGRTGSVHIIPCSRSDTP
jgi:hypothetical protein